MGWRINGAAHAALIVRRLPHAVRAQFDTPRIHLAAARGSNSGAPRALPRARHQLLATVTPPRAGRSCLKTSLALLETSLKPADPRLWHAHDGGDQCDSSNCLWARPPAASSTGATLPLSASYPVKRRLFFSKPSKEKGSSPYLPFCYRPSPPVAVLHIRRERELDPLGNFPRQGLGPMYFGALLPSCFQRRPNRGGSGFASPNQVVPLAGPGRGTTPKPERGGVPSGRTLSDVGRTLSDDACLRILCIEPQGQPDLHPVVKANWVKERAKKEKAPSSPQVAEVRPCGARAARVVSQLVTGVHALHHIVQRTFSHVSLRNAELCHVIDRLE